MNKLDTLISCLPDAPYKQHLTDEVASLREQLSNMMALVAQLERERDDSMNSLRVALEVSNTRQDNLVAMTKERDEVELIGRVAIYDLQKKLSACQALCQQYREALEKLAKLGNGDYYGTSIGNSIAYSALTLPSPTAALNNAIAEELEKMAKVFEKQGWPFGADDLTYRAKELREMK